MGLIDLIKTSLLNLSRQRLRAIVSTFAVVVGALLITLMVSIGNGLQRFIESQVSAFSTPITISVNPQVSDTGLSFAGFGTEPKEITDESKTETPLIKTFSADELKTLENLDHVEEMEQLVNFQTNYVKLDGSDKKYQALVMYMPDFQTTNMTLVAGRMIEKEDSKKIVVTQQFAEVWGYEENLSGILGKTLFVHATQSTAKGLGILTFGDNPLADPTKAPEERDFEFEIVGVTEKGLASTIMLISRVESIEIARFVKNDPKLYTEDADSVYEVSIKLDSEENAKAVDEEIEKLGFRSTTYDDLLGQLGEMFNVINVVLSAFGFIALAVASLGIMNTMLMAIFERTREIGIMKAVGARNSDIRILFTIEAGFIGFLGGIGGLIFGFAFGQLANWILHEYSFLEDYPALNISIVDLPLILTVIGVTTIVALISGLYPASRASKLDPIEALRHE